MAAAEGRRWVSASPDMSAIESSERRFKLSRNALRLYALFDEYRGRLMPRSSVVRLLLDRPPGRLIRTRHTFQRKAPGFRIQQQLMTAQTADELAEPRPDARPITGGAGTHDFLPRGPTVSMRRMRTQVKCQLNQHRYLSRTFPRNPNARGATIETNERRYETSRCRDRRRRPLVCQLPENISRQPRLRLPDLRPRRRAPRS